MDFQEFVYQAGDVILLTAIPPLLLFIFFYATRSPWRKTVVGRSLMYFAVSLAVMVITVALSLWLGTEYFFREWFRLASYLFASITTWRLFLILRHIQKQRPSEIKDADQTDTPEGSDTHA